MSLLWAFFQSKYDHTMFTCCFVIGGPILLLYLDDRVVIGEDVAYIAYIKLSLMTCLVIKDLGPFHYTLGIVVAVIFLCQ